MLIDDDDLYVFMIYEHCICSIKKKIFKCAPFSNFATCQICKQWQFNKHYILAVFFFSLDKLKVQIANVSRLLLYDPFT